MRYAVFSGPEGEETTFEGMFATTKEADIQVESGEDKSGLFYRIVDTLQGTLYTTGAAPLPEAVLTSERDYATVLRPGQGLWLEARNPEGGKVTVHIVHQLVMGNLRVEAMDESDPVADLEPLDEFVVEFV